MSNRGRERVVWIDLLKCFAIATVVIVHATENVYKFNLDYMNEASLHTQIFAFSLFTLGRLGVPIFLMCSGYLLLDREYDEQRIAHFWKNNLLQLFITTEIWMIIYTIFMCNFQKTSVTAADVIQYILFLKQTKASQLWYMPVIMGIYLFLPFIATFLKKTGWKFYILPLTIAVAYYGIVPVINVFLSSAKSENLLTVLPSLEFSGGIYGALLVLGYMIKKGAFKRVKSIWLILAGVISFVCAVWMQLYSFHHENFYTIWYNNIFLVVACVCVFLLFSRLPRIRCAKVFVNLSKCSFGIYLFHNIMVTILREYLMIYSAAVRVIVVWGITFAVSWLVVWLVSHNKIAAKILFFIR